MTQFPKNDELETLKDQMQVLKAQLSQNEIINQNTLDSIFHSNVKDNTSRRSMYAISMIFGLALIGAVVYYGFVQGKISPCSTISCILFVAVCTIISLRNYKMNIRDSLLNTPLTESVSSIMKWRKQNQVEHLILLLAALAFISVVVIDNYADFITDKPGIIFFVIILLPIVTRIQQFLKVQKITNELLSEIKGLNDQSVDA